MSKSPFINAALVEGSAPPPDDTAMRDFLYRSHIALHQQADEQNEALTELRTQMRSLLGNGQPGRIGMLERTLEGHKKFIWGMGGAMALAFTLIGWLIGYAK